MPYQPCRQGRFIPCHISYRGIEGRKAHKRQGAYAGVQWQAHKGIRYQGEGLEAKKYGVLYAAVINKKQPDGIVDVVVNANDAARVNRITERFALSTVDVEKIRADIMKAREEKAKQDAVKERTTPPAEKEAHTVDENTLDAMMAKPVQQATAHKQPAEVTEKLPNPTKARTEITDPSEPSSDTHESIAADKSERPSVRQKIQELKAERQADKTAEKQPQRDKARQTTHQQPSRTKKKTKSKER